MPRRAGYRFQRRTGKAILALIGLCLASSALPASAATWQLDVRSGLPVNFSSDLHIEQEGQPTLHHDPDWASESTKIPIYWDLRLSRRSGDRGWAVDLMHHKLILDNPTEDITWFSISHGYNILLAQRLGWRGPWQWHFGAGVVIAHPESEIRGLRWEEKGGLWNGEFLSGPAASAGIGRDFALWGPLVISSEARFTLSHVGVNIRSGDARLTHAGLHLLLGLGLRR